MTDFISSVISEVTDIFGVCKFDDIKDSLLNCRKLSLIPEKSQSVIVMLFPYLLDEDYSDSDISKYAVVRDYHDVICEALEKVTEKIRREYPEEEFVYFTDNSPIPEVKAAVLSGLGVMGKNGLLINEKYGSWVFIGEIVTTMEMSTQKPKETSCINCGNCIKLCPGSAIGENGIDKTLCLSDITQKKCELSAEETELIRKSGCAWGCDVCQNVCPMNKDVTVNPFFGFVGTSDMRARTDGDISDRAYAWRGKKVIERNLHITEKKEG